MSDKPRSSIKPVNIDDLKSGWHTKQHNFAKFAKELGINRWALKSYVERTLKPGIKVFGKRHFSNIDDVAEFLLKKQREIQSKPAASSIKPIVQPANNIYGIGDAQKLKNLAKVHAIPSKEIEDVINAYKLVGHDEKKVIKHFSKILNDEGTSSKVLRKYIADQTRRVYDPVGLLKDYVNKNTDIRWRTIQNALDTGKSPRRILDDLKGKTGKVGLNVNPSGEIDFTGEHKYAEDLQKEFKKKNAQRRAYRKLVKSTGNKIVPTNRHNLQSSKTMFDPITEGVPKSERNAARQRLIRKSKRARMEKGFWKTPQGKISKSARNTQKMNMRQLLKMAKDSSVFKEITGKLKPISLQQQFKQFQAVDDAINLSSGNYEPKSFEGGSRNLIRVSDAEWKRMNNAAATKHVNKLGTNLRYFDHNLQKLVKERNRLLYEMNKKLKAGVDAPKIPKSSQLKIRNLASGIKGAATQLGAGIAINALADKFVRPHTDAAATRLGTSLGRWAKDFDEKQLKKKNAKKKKEK